MSRGPEHRVWKWIYTGVWVALLLAGQMGQAVGTWEVLTRPDTIDQVYGPHAMTVDKAGNLYVADVRDPYASPHHSRLLMRTSQGEWSVLASEGAEVGQVSLPISLVVDGSGNLYVGEGVDSNHPRVQMRTPQGIWSVIASKGAAPDQVSNPISIVVDKSGNLYVRDDFYSRLQMRTPQGVWSVLAPSGANIGQVSDPTDMTVDGSGRLFVIDYNRIGDIPNYRIQMRTAQGGWSVIASSGSAPDQVSRPTSLAVDGSDNLYVADGGEVYAGEPGNHRVQMRSPNGVWSVIASRGSAPNQVEVPRALIMDGAGTLYVWDYGNNRVLMRSPKGVWSVIALNGTDPDQVDYPKLLAADGSGNLFIGDEDSQRVQMRTTQGAWSVIAASGNAPDQVDALQALATDASGHLYVADIRNGNGRILTRTPEGEWSLLFDPVPNQASFPVSLAVDGGGNLFVGYAPDNRVEMRTPQGSWSVIADYDLPPYQDVTPIPMAVDGSGNLFIGDRVNHRVTMRSPQGIWSVIASEGTRTDQVTTPQLLALDGSGNLYIGDDGNRRIQMRTPQGVWSVIAPEGEALGQVLGSFSMGADEAGNLFVAELGDPAHLRKARIQKRTPQGSWSLIASMGTASDQVGYPTSLAVDAVGNLFIGDSHTDFIDARTAEMKEIGNQRVQMRTPQGVWSVIASTGTAPDQVYLPSLMMMDRSRHLYVGDGANHRIQRFTIDSPILYGDLDLDGTITLSDVILCLNVVVGFIPSTPDLVKLGDVSPRKADGTFGNGALGTDDVVRLLRRVIGLEADPWP